MRSCICWLVGCLRLHSTINLTTRQYAQLATNKVYKHMHMQLYAAICSDQWFGASVPENRSTIIAMDAYLETRFFWIKSIGKHSNLSGPQRLTGLICMAKNLIAMEKLFNLGGMVPLAPWSLCLCSE